MHHNLVQHSSPKNVLLQVKPKVLELSNSRKSLKEVCAAFAQSADLTWSLVSYRPCLSG